MAKRQNFIVGSTNGVTQQLSPTELNHGFDQYEILTADELDGVFNAVSDFSNDSSNEIANAIQSITGSQPTGATQTELADALEQMREEILTSSLRFIGYVSTTAPSTTDYLLDAGDLWINAASMPTSFPVAASDVKEWNGSAWVAYGADYTPADFEAFRNINDSQGYYWFGGEWTLMSADMDTNYFELNASGKWTIKNIVTTDTNQTVGGIKTFSSSPLVPNVGTMNDNSQKAASTKFVLDILKTIYPIGSVYIGTQNSCPMSALFGTWELVATDRALWGGNGTNGNTTIAAGLPNITADWGAGSYNTGASGAVVYNVNNNPVTDYGGGYAWTVGRFELSASRSSSIYGNSNTVQPPAYRVNVWRRTA